MPDEPRTPSSILEHIFTHPNPQTGSQPPEHIAWVVFAEGTIFYTPPMLYPPTRRSTASKRRPRPPCRSSGR